MPACMQILEAHPRYPQRGGSCSERRRRWRSQQGLRGLLNCQDINRIHREGNGTQSSTLAWQIPMDGGAWWAAAHEVARSRTRLSDFTFTFHFHALEKEMATHSSVLAWRIPGTGEPDGLSSMGSHRVRHDYCDLAAVNRIHHA